MIAGLIPLFALQAGSPPAIVPSMGEFSPTERTQPRSRYDCDAAEPDGKRLAFVVKVAGLRGYRNELTGEVESTPAQVAVTGDLEGYRWREGGPSEAFDGFRTDAGGRYGKHVELRLHSSSGILTTEKPGRVAVFVNRFWDWMPLTQAVGFCQVTLTAQSPLTPAETRELSK